MISNTLSIETIVQRIIPIFEEYHVNKAILFGSYAQGNAIENSDIDLYVDTNCELKGLDFVGLLETLVSALGVDIDLIDRSHIDEGSPILKEIENGGIVIYEKSKESSKDN